MKLRHIAIQSSNPDESARFYRDAFDLEEVGQIETEGGRAVFLSDGVINLALFELYKKGLPNSGPLGLNHLGFVVADRPAAMARLEQLGARCILPPQEGAGAGGYEVKYEGPDGVQFDVASHPWPGCEQV